MKCYIVANTWYGDVEEQLVEIFERYKSIEQNVSETILLLFGTKPEKLVSEYEKAYFIKAEIEEYLPVLEKLFTLVDTDSCVLFGYDLASRQLAVRLALKTQGSSANMVERLHMEATGCIVEKKIYSENILGEYQLTKKPYCISVVKKGIQVQAKTDTVLEEVPNIALSEHKSIICVEETMWGKKDSLSKAEKVLILGNGIKRKEDVEMFQKVAQRTGAVLGGSRPLVMQGLLPMDRMVGVSGSIIHAKICIVVGVSGMAAFYEGIEQSHLVISINRDQEAPIIKKSDKAVISDWKKINWNKA